VQHLTYIRFTKQLCAVVDDNNVDNNPKNKKRASNSSSSSSGVAVSSWRWRTNLAATAPHWRGWFQGWALLWTCSVVLPTQSLPKTNKDCRKISSHAKRHACWCWPTQTGWTSIWPLVTCKESFNLCWFQTPAIRWWKTHRWLLRGTFTTLPCVSARQTTCCVKPTHNCDSRQRKNNRPTTI